ncbi:TNF receptor-associated factor 6-like [Amblyomma americanum]
MMSAGGMSYTLFGFGDELDWRPLRFVKPIPGNKLCRACGLVCRKTALLPCLHLLCDTCYGQCAENGQRVCPLDDQRFQEEEVDWKETPVDEILSRKVKCWNQDSGCSEVMAASEIWQHFQRHCGRHSISCPKCSATVVRRDVCAHLRSDCRAVVTPFTSECYGHPSFRSQPGILSSFKRALKQQGCEIRPFLERFPADRGPRDNKLDQTSHSVNAFKETLRQELIALSESLKGLPELMKESLDSFATSVSKVVACNEQMKECLKARTDHQAENFVSSINAITEALKNDLVIPTKLNADRLAQIADAVEAGTARREKTLQRTKGVLWVPGLYNDHCVFFVKGVEALKEATLKTGSAIYTGGKVYLRGYCISPGVWFEKNGESVMVHAALKLHEGYVDDYLTWPFAYNVKLSVVHPMSGAECINVVIPAPFGNLERPTNSSNELAWFPHVSFKLEDLTRDGYVHHGWLRVKWELLL